MKIIITKQDELINLLEHNENVIVKYHTEKDCPTCVELLPVYERLSGSPEYANIKFVRMDATENPVAQQLINKNKLPFAVIYKDGLLLECGSVTTESDLKKMLKKLPDTKINL